MITVDFETEAIRPRPYYPPKPVGVAVKEDGQPARYYAWGHPTNNNCTEEEGRRVLAEIWGGQHPLLFHNAKFDLEVAKVHLDLPIPPWSRVHDTQFLLYLLNPHAKSFALKPSAERLLGWAPEEQDEVRDWVLMNVLGASNAKGSPNYWAGQICKAPGDLVGRYACGDVDRTYALYQHCATVIDTSGMNPAYDRERRLMQQLLAAERRGVRFDLDSAQRDEKLYQNAWEEADRRILARLNANINLNSGDELADALLRSGAVRELPLTPKGRVSTAKDVLENAIEDRELYSLLRYRGVLKTCVGTFLSPLCRQAEENGGRVHTQWHQTRGDFDKGGTVTGRLCVAAETPIETRRGAVQIVAIRLGEEVLTHKGRWRPVIGKFYKGIEKMYTVGLSNGQTFRCTAQHRILDTCGRWRHLHEYFQGASVGCRTLSESGGKVLSSGQADDTRVDVGVLHHFRDSHRHPSRSLVARGLHERESAAVFQVEDWCEVSNVREDTRAAPQLERSDLRWEGVPTMSATPMVHGEETVRVHARAGDAGERWANRFTRGVGSSPHRWRQAQQFPGELSLTDQQCAFPLASLAQGVHIVRIEEDEVAGVWDVCVADDHSYVACGVAHHNSSIGPNFQNVPNDFSGCDAEGFPHPPTIRKYFLPEPGHVWIKRDYSAQEVRVLAHFEDGALLEAFQADPRLDPHLFAQQLIERQTGVHLDRKVVKAVAFSILYGSGAKSLSERLGVSYDEALRIKTLYLAAFPDVQGLMRDVTQRGTANLPVRTTGGRLIYVEPPQNGRTYAYKMLNHLIQGSAADVTKQAVVNMGGLWPFLATVHDEINISAPAEDARGVAEDLRKAMESVPLDAPLTSDCYVGQSWADADANKREGW